MPKPKQKAQRKPKPYLNPKITISYRRSDTKPIAGRIAGGLEEHYGKGVVFIDFDHIPYGIDFREHIVSQVTNSNILLAIIGPNWRGKRTWPRKPRIQDNNDYVRIEVATALKSKVRIIPVLVDKTEIPNASELPEELKPLSSLNAAPLDSGPYFRNDMKRLIRNLPRKPKPPKPPGDHRGRGIGGKSMQPLPPSESPIPPTPASSLPMEDLRLRVTVQSAGGPKTIDCKIDRGALRDLVAHHKLGGTQDDCVRALQPNIERIASKVYTRRGLEKNGELSIRSNDLVLHGFG